MNKAMPERNKRANEVAAAIAQRNAMERGCVFLPHGSRLMLVEQGWESKVIAQEPGTLICDTLLRLETALRNPEARRIFVPQGAVMSDEEIEKVCQRNGVSKSIFRETGRK